MSFLKKHNKILILSAGLYATLSIIIAVVPAFEAERTPALNGMQKLNLSAARGREIYLEEGCGVCHTQFVRDLPMDKPYGRGSLPGDFALEAPPLLGTQRTGPDLSNVGVRQPSEVWNLIHLYNPRAVVPTSVMPGYPWMFEEKDSNNVQENDVTVSVPPKFALNGKIIVANQDALDLVKYIQSLKQVEVSND